MGSTTCEVCVAGKAALAGSAECLICATGRYSGNPMSATCTDCPAGKAIDTQHLSQSSGVAGATVCEDCELGMYSPQPAQSTCNECAIDTFQNETGKDFCYDCPFGYGTDHDKQDHCMAWPTSAPTAQPTNPTGRPTGQPTGGPTGSPTGQPTRRPTGQPTRNPTGQPTSSPTLYIPENQLRSGDPLSAVGTNSNVFALAIVSAMFCCCLLVGCIYRRRRVQKTKDAELSPYEKWMQAEEAKRAGVQAPMFHSQHGPGANVAKLDNKALSRTNKLHTKHGVTINTSNAKKEGAAESSDDFGAIYDNEDNLQGTWGEMGYDSSTHNPLSGNGPHEEPQENTFEVRDSAVVDGTDIYGDQDMEGGGMYYGSGNQDGYLAEDGQWYPNEGSNQNPMADYNQDGYWGDDGQWYANEESTHNPMADMNDNQAFDDEEAVAKSRT